MNRREFNKALVYLGCSFGLPGLAAAEEGWDNAISIELDWDLPLSNMESFIEANMRMVVGDEIRFDGETQRFVVTEVDDKGAAVQVNMVDG